MITGWKNINSSDSTSHHDGKTGFNGAELRGVGCLRVPEPGTVPLPCELLPPGRRASGGRWRTPPHRYILPSDHICRRMRTLGQAFRGRIPSLSQFRKVCSAFLCGLLTKHLSLRFHFFRVWFPPLSSSTSRFSFGRFPSLPQVQLVVVPLRGVCTFLKRRAALCRTVYIVTPSFCSSSVFDFLTFSRHFSFLANHLLPSLHALLEPLLKGFPSNPLVKIPRLAPKALLLVSKGLPGTSDSRSSTSLVF